jgi:flavin-dependent dehydrogenase
MPLPCRHVDLVVIGAGPAGCAAAITASQMGQSVLLIERTDFPRHRPGETLHPGVEPLLRQLGVWEHIRRAEFIRHPGHWILRDEQRHFSAFGGTADEPWLGIQAWRPTFDAILLQRAEAAGAVLWQPCHATSPIMQGERIIGVMTNAGEVRARYLIDATGRGEWLSRRRQSTQTRCSPRLLATYGYIETEQASEWFLPTLERTSMGWIWTAQVRTNTIAWTKLSYEGGACRSGSILTRIGGQPIEVQGSAADVTWRYCNQAAGAGWFIVGDAAVTLDPDSSHGILRALMSGMMAAHLIAQVCRGRSQKDVAACYNDWLYRWLKHDVKSLEAFYHERAWPLNRMDGF